MSAETYLLESGAISAEDLNLNKNNARGRKIANATGAMFNGWWKEANAFVFTEPETGSSFLAKDIDEAIKKIKDKRNLWKRMEEKYAAS